MAHFAKQLPVPGFYNAENVERIAQVPYQQRFDEALAWKAQHGLKPASLDATKIGLLIIDAQNTFCLPSGELYVGGRSGRGAMDDNDRLARFIYRELGNITGIHPTMDTHSAFQIFHVAMWIDQQGKNPPPATIITLQEIESGKWRVNPAAAGPVAGDPAAYSALQDHVLHFAQTLSDGGKYPLMIWPFHSMLGGVGHALVAGVEEACFFQGIARSNKTDFQIKGGNPLTENYSILAPEVLFAKNKKPIAQRNTKFIEALLKYDIVVIAGQAKSHCVAWSIADLLTDIQARDPKLAQKVYLLEDCTSPVVIPGVLDFTDAADQAFAKFADAGMHLVKSTDPIESWPALPLAA